MFNGSICCPVRNDDLNACKERKNAAYTYGYFAYHWKPKEGIPIYVVDDRIEKVFVICYSDEPADAKQSIIKAAEFMMEYAKGM